MSETGTGQGQTISPLLANTYLHNVLMVRERSEAPLKGCSARDPLHVLCFHYKEDAEKMREVLPKRFAKYGLTLHPEKTRLVEFGRYAEANAKRQGTKPCTLDFLGFTHIFTRSRKGKFTVHVRTMKKTMKKRFRRGLTAIVEWRRVNRYVRKTSSRKP